MGGRLRPEAADWVAKRGPKAVFLLPERRPPGQEVSAGGLSRLTRPNATVAAATLLPEAQQGNFPLKLVGFSSTPFLLAGR